MHLASLSILFLNFGVIFPVMLQALDTLASWPKKRPKGQNPLFFVSGG